MLEITSSDPGDDFNVPSCFVVGSGTSFACFKVRAGHVPDVRELSARLVETNPDAMLLHYTLSTGCGAYAVVDGFAPAVGDRLTLLPAFLPELRRIVYERCPPEASRAAPPQPKTRRQKKSR